LCSNYSISTSEEQAGNNCSFPYGLDKKLRITIQKTILPFFTSADFAYLPKMSKGNTFEFVSTAFNNLDLRNIFINKTKTVVEY